MQRLDAESASKRLRTDSVDVGVSAYLDFGFESPSNGFSESCNGEISATDDFRSKGTQANMEYHLDAPCLRFTFVIKDLVTATRLEFTHEDGEDKDALHQVLQHCKNVLADKGLKPI